MNKIANIKSLFLQFLVFSLFVSCDTTEKKDEDTPLDDVVERTHFEEHKILPYEYIREADLFWEKKMWRVIDVREKMNKTFVIVLVIMSFLSSCKDEKTKNTTQQSKKESASSKARVEAAAKSAKKHAI